MIRPPEQSLVSGQKLRLCVLDFGLRNRTGHHYNSARAIIAAADSADVEIRVLAGDTLSPGPELEGRVSPFFRTDLYARRRTFAGSENFESWMMVGDRLARDLGRIPDKVLAEADVIVVPAVSPFHIWVLCEWAKAKLLRAFEATLVIHFMFPPTWSSWGRPCLCGPQMYREALALLRGHVEVRTFLTAEIAASAREVSRVVELPVHVLPHPVVQGGRSAIDDDGSHDSTLTIGVFGNSKREKGFHFLPDVIAKMSARLEKRRLRFVIQVDHAGDDPAIAQAARDLVKMGPPLVEIIEGSLSAETYWSLLERVDLFLLPYDPALYGTRGSGLLSEAATLGVPVVAPGGTGIGEEVAAARAAGVVFNLYQPDAIVAAAVEAVERLPELSQAAGAIAANWRESNSGRGYLRKLRAVTGR